MCSSYLINMFVRMYNLDDDRYIVSTQANPYDDTTFEELWLANQNVWYSFDIRAQANEA